MKPPRRLRPLRRPIDRWAVIWPAIVMSLLGVIAVFIFALQANHSALDAKRAATATVHQLRSRIRCINESLAVRQRYIDQDHAAEVAKVSGQVRGLLQLRSDAEGGILQFTRASEHYLARIAAIDREQKKHPLGAC